MVVPISDAQLDAPAGAVVLPVSVRLPVLSSMIDEIVADPPVFVMETLYVTVYGYTALEGRVSVSVKSALRLASLSFTTEIFGVFSLFVNVQVVLLPDSIVMPVTLLFALSKLPVLAPLSSVQVAALRVQFCGTVSVTVSELFPMATPIGRVWPEPVIVYFEDSPDGTGFATKLKLVVEVVFPLATFLMTRKPPPGETMQSNGLLLPPFPADGYEQTFTRVEFAGKKAFL